MYTSHGHHIQGTEDTGAPASRARCGGVGLCQECTDETVAYRQRKDGINALREELGLAWSSSDERKDFVVIAKKVVQEYYTAWHPEKAVNVYVVWFAKALQNWKALVSSDMGDGRYFELTYNGDADELYADVYVKKHNSKIENFKEHYPT